jgi:UDP-2,3-diacylglucosamine hydrolase
VKYYFASDVHLGLPPDPLTREKRFVKWLDNAGQDAAAIFLLGDIFDFWFEYKTVVPKGFVRTLGKIAELCDAGIPVHFFTGNHDLWVRDYLPSETGMIIHFDDYITELYGRRFYLTHGDVLNANDKTQRRLRRVFTNNTLRKLYSAVHPYFGVKAAHAWSRSNRKKHQDLSLTCEHPLYRSILEKAQANDIDYFIMGHIHTPLIINDNGFELAVLPDWIAGSGGFAEFNENGNFNLLKIE